MFAKLGEDKAKLGLKLRIRGLLGGLWMSDVSVGDEDIDWNGCGSVIRKKGSNINVGSVDRRRNQSRLWIIV